MICKNISKIVIFCAGILVSCSTPTPRHAITIPSTAASTQIATVTTVTPATTSTSESTAIPTPAQVYKPELQGFSPHALAITQNGEYAYIGFDLSEVVLKVRLRDMAVIAKTDLSAYFPVESEESALDESEKKLFVYSPTWQNLIVIDTQSMTVIDTIEDIPIISMIRSKYGPYLITWTGGNSVKFVNTETYEVTEYVDQNEFFLKIQESNSNQDLWYVIHAQEPGPTQVNAGIYNHKTKTWIRKFSLPPDARADTVFDFDVLSNEQKAYVATFGGIKPDGLGYGWLYSINLVSGEVKVVSIDGGAMCVESSPDNQRVYVGTFAPISKKNNLMVVDTQSDEIVDQIDLGQTQYGWHFTQMNHLQVDPSNDHILYGTNTDANALIKVNLDTLTPGNVLIFNHESFQPHFFVRQTGQSFGYILIKQNKNAFVFDLNEADVIDVVKLPIIRDDAYIYDVAINELGRMFIVQGETILEVDTKDFRLIQEHSIPKPITGLWSLILSNDQRDLFSIWPGPASGGYPPDTFLRISTSNFQVQANVKLFGGGFNSRPFELPDGSKLYALGGLQNGPITIQVIDLESNTLKISLTFDEPGFQGISAGPYYPFAFDSETNTLFVGATQVVLAIDTRLDVIKKVINLSDAARAIGLEPQQVTYLNAIGLVYNPQENYLYIAHLDRSFISIYDLKNEKFLPQVIPLKGYFPSFVFANDDYSKIFALNGRSDSVSVINVKSKTVENVIDLHAYLAQR